MTTKKTIPAKTKTKGPRKNKRALVSPIYLYTSPTIKTWLRTFSKTKNISMSAYVTSLVEKVAAQHT